MKSFGSEVIWKLFKTDRERARSALALPDQDQADGGQHGAVSGPLKLADHETRLRPLDRAGALADPEQPEGEREEANDQEPVTHGVCLVRAVAARHARWRWP